ncbi:McrB family protein [Streptococcus suis]|uniref:McrB family protein n=1 Tax=Streptococcus suis TaxID=1307 RepID=UPI0037579E20
MLEQKINELEAAQNYECWYLVKQDTSFISLCYQVEFLRQFQEDSKGLNLESFIKNRVSQIKSEKNDVTISETHRALRVAAFFGLITMTSNSYNTAQISPTFYEIKELCDGNFEKIELYKDIVQRQIEKMFISSSIDEEYKGIRKDFRLFPVMFLYKILIELGKATGDYSISINEYRYLVATSKKYEDYLNTLILIILLREDITVNSVLEKYRMKFDNRLIQALKQLQTLVIDNEKISIPVNQIDEVKNKVYQFEKLNVESVSDVKYLSFLASTQSLLESEFNPEDQIDEITETNNRKVGGENILFYGVPGSGKSHAIDSKYGNERMYRVVFHPDYMNTDFIGQILPTIKEDETISYEFKPGPFTKVMRKAYEDPANMYYLIIEEINRGNAPAIFGEIFQLLDRTDSGESKYSVVNYDISKAIFDNDSIPIRIPSNLTILATMNTSDQNVFTLDTAFQRRWTMKLILNDINKAEHKNVKISDTSVTWGLFNKVINELIISSNASMLSSEDKRLGAYFISPSDLSRDDIEKRFSEKVIKYLWDDAFKFSRDKLFNTTSYKSLEDIIIGFLSKKADERFIIFKDEIRDLLSSESADVMETTDYEIEDQNP